MLTRSIGLPKTPKQVRDVAVSVSLSADTAADQADGAIAHPARVTPSGGPGVGRTASRACSSVG
jgi:hypothetical protein